MTNSALTALLQQGRDGAREETVRLPNKIRRPVILRSVILWSWGFAAVLYFVLVNLLQ